MQSTGKRLLFLFLLLILLLCTVTVMHGQMRNLGPSMDLVNMQQIQALRAELAKLRVELIACHDELDQVQKQLKACEKGAGKTIDEKPAPSIEKNNNSSLKNQEDTPTP